MSLSPGVRLGPYEIIQPIGRGGMGEVYRARDTRLSRDVALKVIHAELGADPERRARLDREARAVAALDHPNICPLFDVGESGGVNYLVMPLLDGGSLSARLAERPMPISEALRIGQQLAMALAAAHRAGVVHRDIKPANVMLTGTGAKLLDFGLSFDTSPGALGETVEHRLSQPGMLLGTMAYMSPEQLQLGAVDARSDIFSLGLVLYEMVSGRRPFAAENPMEAAALTLTSEPPPLEGSIPGLPAALARLVHRCLAKSKDDRFQSAADLAFAIESVSNPSSSSANRPVKDPGSTSTARSLSTRWLWPTVTLLCVLGWVLTALRLLPGVTPAVAPSPTRFALNPPEGLSFVQGLMPVISPDGTKVAASLRDRQGRRGLWILDQVTGQARALPNTGSTARWFWKPDSRMLGFFAEGQVQVVNVSGGAPVTLTNAGTLQGFGGAWNLRDTILLAPSDTGLSTVPAAGGTLAPLTEPAGSSIGEWWPVFLPDGQRFVSFLETVEERTGVQIASLDAPAPRLLVASSGRGTVAGDHLLFPRDGTLFAQRLNLGDGTLTGAPLSLGISVGVNPNGLNTLVSASDSGALIFASEEFLLSRMLWFDRRGQVIAEVGELRAFRDVMLSPDGTAVLEDRRDRRTGRHQVWRTDLARGTASLLIDGGYHPSWSPDGQRIAFSIARRAPATLALIAADGSGATVPIGTAARGLPNVTDWSPDGRSILYNGRNGSADAVMKMPVDGGARTTLSSSKANAASGRLSPDGRWLTYQADESGRFEIYLMLLETGARHQVSSDGGAEPRWRRDGRELFFLDPDGNLMSAEIGTGPNPLLGRPVRLFATGSDAGARIGVQTSYDLTADGQRFLVRVPTAPVGRSPVTMILDWKALLPR